MKPDKDSRVEAELFKAWDIWFGDSKPEIPILLKEVKQKDKNKNQKVVCRN